MSDSMAVGIACFIFICAYGIGYFTCKDSLDAERADNEELRQVIFDSRSNLGSERDGSGDVANCARAHFPSDGGNA